MRKPNLQKQAIPDLFSKTRGNISVTIALKGQGLTWQCSSSAFFGKHSLENASAFKKGTQNTPSAWCSPQVTDPCSGSYVQGVKTPSSSGSRCHGDNWMMDSQMIDRQMKRQQIDDPLCQESPLCLENYRSFFFEKQFFCQNQKQNSLALLPLYMHSATFPKLFSYYHIRDGFRPFDSCLTSPQGD